jgi:hypothetical protein
MLKNYFFILFEHSDGFEFTVSSLRSFYLLCQKSWWSQSLLRLADVSFYQELPYTLLTHLVRGREGLTLWTAQATN